MLSMSACSSDYEEVGGRPSNRFEHWLPYPYNFRGQLECDRVNSSQQILEWILARRSNWAPSLQTEQLVAGQEGGELLVFSWYSFIFFHWLWWTCITFVIFEEECNTLWVNPANVRSYTRTNEAVKLLFWCTWIFTFRFPLNTTLLIYWRSNFVRNKILNWRTKIHGAWEENTQRKREISRREELCFTNSTG